MSAFARALLRSVRTSLGRFLAIVGIVALGCGFLAGLKMVGMDMRTAQDAYYDNQGLWDLKLISTMGFEDADVQTLQAQDDITDVQPVLLVDAKVSAGDTDFIARISTFDSSSSLDKLTLEQGRWPISPSECLVVEESKQAVPLGQEIDVASSDDVDTMLAHTHLRVVGTVSSPEYVNSQNFGSTNMGSGTLDQVIFVLPEAFSEDVPAVALAVGLRDATALESGSTAYENLVEDARTRVEDMVPTLAERRQNDLKQEAQDELDSKKLILRKAGRARKMR
ncbi:MAG: hypothetical protein ACOX4F_06855 [Atopobiaceae bacterium]